MRLTPFRVAAGAKMMMTFMRFDDAQVVFWQIRKARIAIAAVVRLLNGTSAGNAFDLPEKFHAHLLPDPLIHDNRVIPERK